MNRQSNATAGTGYIARRIVGTAMVHILFHGSQRQNSSWINWIVSSVALTSLSLCLLADGKAEAASSTFEKIVDTNTPVPGSTGNFSDFSAPSLDSGNVAFSGIGEESNGIYTSIDGKLNIVADTNTLIPGSTRNFEGFRNLSLQNRYVAFDGGADFYEESFTGGIYTNTGGKLNIVADTNTSIPGGVGNFENFDYLSLDNGNVAFQGNGGIYTNIGGELDVVADKNTPVPGNTGNFDPYNFRGVSLDNGNVAFQGLDSGSNGGIYTNIGGELDVVADKNTPTPGTTRNFFTEFGNPELDNGNVAFAASSGFITDFGGITVIEEDQYGIYVSTDGELSVIADRNAPVPNDMENFDFFGFLFDKGNVAFVGRDGPKSEYRYGIYTNVGGMLAEVIAEGDLLDGKRVIDVRGLGGPTFVPETFTFGSEGLSGNQIAFKAVFEDDSQGIYIATVPEPASVLGTLAFSAFGTGWLLKQRQKNRKVASSAKPIKFNA